MANGQWPMANLELRKPLIKRRSDFRFKPADLMRLYQQHEVHELTGA